ncbi:3-methyladenine DNA glycosylase/8-oxoguanine DNA glycosylase [Pseudonocardia sediminis]|uniref:3-methyladenine DNA glycosylase/8-oxoguanine DNA glycosylase n=1 Tax=Pseudonocardia sediminis TaxID=1397368 RepID=A0A4Q7V601_PSEST|nr:DNA-3-methyladenine glycosylase 2 family protein [Pseudonocardia sediminis]RZT88203.1 3-methyladenine DNA glycosylase/8-oxoguanine DNA glycosylase [Pseudonocardia sediminis]
MAQPDPAGRTGRPVEREWLPPFVLDLYGVLSPLRRGRGDPTWRTVADGATIWRVSTTPQGPATLAIRRRADGTVRATGWGPGAAWEIDGLPSLLGADDDPSSFTAYHPIVADARRRMPGMRLGSTRRIWDTLLPAILEQKVTGTEARRSFRELCRRFGAPAPGPEGVVPAGMRVPPTPARIRAVPDWEWHRAGVDHARRRAILHCAVVAHRLERAAELRGEEGRQLLRRVPGIGVWTAAEVAQRAWGDPDAVSFGDFHVPNTVGHALLGHDLDDVGMLEVLAPYVPQRQRAVRYIEASGFRRPRFGPRFSPRDYRDM